MNAHIATTLQHAIATGNEPLARQMFAVLFPTKSWVWSPLNPSMQMAPREETSKPGLLGKLSTKGAF